MWLLELLYHCVVNNKGKIHHFSCGCPINADGNCNQLKQQIPQFVIY